jgi:ABC-type glutathione transport system ATPase component
MRKAAAMSVLRQDVLLKGSNIRKVFRRKGGWFSKPEETVALDDVSFEVGRGEILGIVGESGCGKSTLARALVGLVDVDDGAIELDGRKLCGPDMRPVRSVDRGIQMVFQDPYASLNPRMQVGEIVGEGLAIAGDLSRRQRQERVHEILSLVGLSAADAAKYPFQFSGGQRQRVCVARAIIMEPKLLIADEAVSALDVSVQMQILNLLLDLRERLGISIIFITHDIAVVEYLCDRVVVMFNGQVVEENDTFPLIDAPRHDYTRKLISAVPRLAAS